MALIKCNECNKEVSDKATSCPQCGVPIGTKSVDTTVKTIQETSKPLKLQLILSVLTIIIGIFIAFDDKEAGMSTIVIAFAWHSITKCRIWWNHK